MTFKALHDLLPLSRLRASAQPEILGQRSLILSRAAAKTTGDRAFVVRAPKLWNEPPEEVGSAESVTSSNLFLRAFPDIYGPSAGFALLAYEWKPLFTFSLCEALGNIEKSAIWIKLIMIIKNVLPTPHYSSNIANLKWVLAHNSNSGEPPDLSRLSFLHHRALVLFIWLCAVLLQWTTLKLNVTYLRAQKHSYQT